MAVPLIETEKRTSGGQRIMRALPPGPGAQKGFEQARKMRPDLRSTFAIEPLAARIEAWPSARATVEGNCAAASSRGKKSAIVRQQPEAKSFHGRIDDHGVVIPNR